MNLCVKPADYLKGKIQLPASKSYSIRAFMIAACGGRSTIIQPSDCDDAKVSMSVARSLGAGVVQIKPNTWGITAFQHKPALSRINVKESGTVLRFLLPLLALQSKKARVTGEGTLKGRPNLYLTQTLRRMGIDIKGEGSSEGIPIHMKGGTLRGGKIEIDGSLSSQFISALLITCPQLVENSHLILKGKKLVSTDYIAMTRQILHKTGVEIVPRSGKEYFIKGRQKFQGLKNFVVPSDYGLAAFLLAAAALIPSNVILNGSFQDGLIQADGRILEFLENMGVKMSKVSGIMRIKGPFSLKGGDFSLKDCPDLVPIMAILALFAKGRTRLYDIKHARAKESDRISDLRGELLKTGAKVLETEKELIIYPQDYYKQNCCLDPHNDHRLAMAFCVLGLKIGVCVKDIECTRKSYPRFTQDIKSLGASIKRTS
ncbi:MAG TPA: 3-phosphoshikimate 1-carboxyvinyltransferase [Candidatus Omnitrophica bacterium]|nr:MAG: 3-phosphoshikimate 1-carboxyvinyltransferase [Omnitrophica WOR_2 bacterium GWA2_45_18]OGX18717.1 MAG: 3-phosphoshikimate 1-carboxyvinyltransferase [Omnitrophica WOR_2 bacterium GWC2_45_7]HBR14590.1 3-phosphoshikimate 1-carboxyvinyltransferase [Candidatus Omnitrophota bacterium]